MLQNLPNHRRRAIGLFGQAPEEPLREWAVDCGKPAGLAHAEAFRRIVLAMGLTVEGLVEV